MATTLMLGEEIDHSFLLLHMFRLASVHIKDSFGF
jgi:hypothetical protein